MNIKIEKSTLNGKLVIPPSKSMAHRAIIASSLAKGTNTIYNISYSKDILATIEAMEKLGVKFIKTDNTLIVDSSSLSCTEEYFNCYESGSTLRFIIPIILSYGGKYIFDGEPSLKTRPVNTYYNIFEKSNISYNTLSINHLPLLVEGTLQPKDYTIEGNVSSQFISGLLFGLSNLSEKSTLTIKDTLESKPYVDLTIAVLKDFGVNIINNDYKVFEIEKSHYLNTDYTIEGDFSHLAFFALAGIIGEKIEVFGLNKNSKQGDKEIVNIIKNFGGNVTETEDTYIFTKSKTKGITVDVTNTPDLAPVIFALGVISEGETIVTGIQRLRIKESDRVKSMTTELIKLGGKIEVFDDYVKIIGIGQDSLKGGVTLSSWNDHRVAMTLSILSTICQEPVTITDPTCVNKSFGNFYDVLSYLKCNFSRII